MTEQRTKLLMIFFASLLIIIILLMADRMIIHHGKYFNTRYTDKDFVSLMEKLIQDGVFFFEGDEITVDEEKLNARVKKKSTQDRVRNNISFLHEKKRHIFFDSQSVVISNSRISADNLIERGQFTDRNGYILAYSTIDERTWKHERIYNYAPQFYPIIGHWNIIFGRRNLESVLDDDLSGRRHSPVYRQTSDPMKKLRLGDHVMLTVDAQVQKLAYNLLGDRRGAVVLIDIKTGEIIVAASTPSFDANSKNSDIWQKTFSDKESKQYQNRAFSERYPPGSTFKTIVASAWIEQGMKTADGKGFKVYCNGNPNKYGISDVHPHGTTDLDKAFAESCNRFFSEAGVMLGEQLLNYSDQFGFNNEWNLLPQMKDHQFRSVASTAFIRNSGKIFDVRDFRRNPKLVAQGGIGQNLIMATPLQMAIVAATVANGGILQNPYIVKEIKSGDRKQLLFSALPVTGRRVLDGKTALRLREMMKNVMLVGTGREVKKIYQEEGRYTTLPQKRKGVMVSLAGKTGTAEVGDGGKLPHSWFIGFAPADAPQFAVAVIAENQGFGSLVAAPIAVDVLAEALNQRADVNHGQAVNQ